jgi:hypothetical protein
LAEVIPNLCPKISVRIQASRICSRLFDRRAPWLFSNVSAGISPLGVGPPIATTSAKEARIQGRGLCEKRDVGLRHAIDVTVRIRRTQFGTARLERTLDRRDAADAKFDPVLRLLGERFLDFVFDDLAAEDALALIGGLCRAARPGWSNWFPFWSTYTSTSLTLILGADSTVLVSRFTIR